MAIMFLQPGYWPNFEQLVVIVAAARLQSYESSALELKLLSKLPL